MTKDSANVFKGNCGRNIYLEGKLSLFENNLSGNISLGSSSPRNRFLVFLKAVDIQNAVYRCIDANPGEFRQYRGRDGNNHRTMIVGTVKDKLIVESARGYRG